MSLITKIQRLFEEVATPVENNFKDVKNADGTLLLRITGPVELGSKVEIINADGTLSTPEVQDIALEDGTNISVDAEGTITEVATAAEEASDEAEGEMGVKVDAKPIVAEVPKKDIKKVVKTTETHYEETPAVEAVVEVEMAEDIKPNGEAPASEAIAGNLEERVTALESRISELIDMVKGMDMSCKEMSAEKVALEAEVTDLKTKNEELSKLPAAEAVKTNKFEKVESEETSKSKTLAEKLLARELEIKNK
jgi:FtsZ-binding cell division protein ZapB